MLVRLWSWIDVSKSESPGELYWGIDFGGELREGVWFSGLVRLLRSPIGRYERVLFPE